MKAKTKRQQVWQACFSDRDLRIVSTFNEPRLGLSGVPRPKEYNHAVRWIANTAEEQAIGTLLLGTAQSDGYKAEKRKCNVRTLQAGEAAAFHLRFGLINPDQAGSRRKRILQIRG